MVNIAGRSKGCSVCRQRRIKCDESRPVCNRCKMRGLACDGPKGTAFINHVRDCKPETIRKPLTNADDVYLCYTRKNLPRGAAMIVAFDMIDSYATPSLSPSGSSRDIRLLRSAIRSLSVAFFGHQHRASKQVTEGHTLYVETLNQLNRNLSDPARQTRDETILTVLALVILEAFVPTGSNYYLRHIQGLNRILEIRGTPSKDTDSLKMIQGLRLLLITGSLHMGTPSVFARWDWKQLPWATSDTHGTFRHRVLELLADCTVLLYERRSIYNNRERTTDRAENCVRMSFESLEELGTARKMWEDSFGDFQCSYSDSKHRRDASPYLRDSVSATSMMLYYTAIIYFSDIISSLNVDTYHSSLAVTAASEISKCLEFNSTQKTPPDSQSRTISHLAVRSAWSILGGSSTDEGRRVEELVKRAVPGGIATGLWEDSIRAARTEPGFPLSSIRRV